MNISGIYIRQSFFGAFVLTLWITVAIQPLAAEPLFPFLNAATETCIGVQERTATCVDPKGNPVADAYCTGNNLPKPNLLQDCSYACPPPTTPCVIYSSLGMYRTPEGGCDFKNSSSGDSAEGTGN